MNSIYRYEVPVDGQEHTIALFGVPLAVSCRNLQVVEFWAINRGDGTQKNRTFTVTGTGHPLPVNFWRYWGTAVAPGGELVWHLIEVEP